MVVRMSPHLLGETLVKLVQAGKLIPGGGVTPGCIERWIRNGVNGAVLEICRIGRIRYTSEEAIQRFLEAVNQNPELPAPAIRRLSEKEIEQRKRDLGLSS
ncbi:MAG: DUF1580 domain-containing protein [Thermoguttaceae bacterium]|nr:DUF1580 domain-containing protein [Thermoguttaceae bacterium]